MFPHPGKAHERILEILAGPSRVHCEVKVYFAICDEETLEDGYIQESLEGVLESLRTTRDTEGKPLWDGKAEVIWRLATGCGVRRVR